MLSNLLTEELKKIKAIIPKLEPYWQKEASELPDGLKRELYSIKAIPPLTSSGLERINGVLETLFLAQLNIEDLDQEKMPAPQPEQLAAPQKPKTPINPPSQNSEQIDFGPYYNEKDGFDH